ncbi:hypothetical protein [Acaryochloris marina]|uniref:hypothetical protein n=1 Tax=Acaryochloris marina TaxID=155978 RepID=UPI001BAFD877|nr:hypothetical protein [Acaryochloris marina]QUY45486.1 hypothetical protein I1H34_27320 [Acaryochloris marina S15]
MASKAPKYIMRHSTLLHRQVVDSISRQSLGRVTDLWIDLRQHRVIGFSSHAEYGGISLRSYFWKQIEAIEAQQIVVQSLPTIHPRLILNINPETGMAVKDPLASWNMEPTGRLDG